MVDVPRKLFHKGHSNILAKQFQLTILEIDGSLEDTGTDKHLKHACIRSVCDVAVKIAYRLKEDDPEFDPVWFLNKCSPDVDIWPIGELWQHV